MDINLRTINQAVSLFLRRFHFMVFVIIVFGALGAGIFFVYQNILATDNTRGYTAQTSNTAFDSATSARINALHPADYRLSDQSTEPRAIYTGGRLNPFVE